ncbi:MAG: DUF5678 domain-containing protein [Chloroflexi bacterium]|nr:DUF5678 domain-containing protein [Chloroflexota bacterium]
MIDETIAFEADRAWIDEHIAVLVEQFADHWIAVKGGRIIASEADLGELLGKVADLAHTCVEFIDGHLPIESV